MKPALRTPLMAVAGTATLFAYWAADGLVREFSTGLTWIDTGTLFVLGLIAGAAIAVSAGFRHAA